LLTLLHTCIGAKERGELENRVTKMIQEIKDAGNVVLM
jgi:ATP-dependent Clp protease ATP-binding subunit ClpA